MLHHLYSIVVRIGSFKQCVEPYSQLSVLTLSSWLPQGLHDVLQTCSEAESWSMFLAQYHGTISQDGIKQLSSVLIPLSRRDRVDVADTQPFANT